MPEPGREETVRVVALDKNFHMKCYKCEVSCPCGPSGLEWWDTAHQPGGGWRQPCGNGCCNFEGGQWQCPCPRAQMPPLLQERECGGFGGLL